MIIRRLNQNDTPILLKTINAAFADYIVPFQLTEAQLQSKITSENILLDWSIGVFLEDEMVAFIMHGVRNENRKTKVYNAGTGVIPTHRGKALVDKMYDFIQDFLLKNHTNQLILEVIEGNSSAIRAYEKNGFKINRKLLCFSGILDVKLNTNIAKIRILNDINWDELRNFWDISPSWQSSNESMKMAKPTALGAFVNDHLVGYVLFNPTNKRVYQIAVSKEFRRKGIGKQLFQEVQNQLSGEKMQVNNVDEAGENLKLFFEDLGLKNDINQFEMTKYL
ncbi:GNAT family N-acetyltransferase [Flavobacterium sp. xlx-214]|uniref:GNAT family N-acetyltransferase n=1 Tax=unclassified Flavobacterium TaxID=196869 RepID=UPI0013D88B4B|nr:MULTISPECIES: GNAT family N-acetyltransferase [unclassified Flavobacterium]MBA5791509.1 GNAT family N-acetyltransferase [Flavobacterium sp. xlx-221]QMI83341.1 GNAT family N-acetyltransferase [Flavobacterium sp. xlx-214]